MGHYYGPDTSPVDQEVEAVDAVIGDFLEGLDYRGIMEKTNVVIVSDHGKN